MSATSWALIVIGAVVIVAGAVLLRRSSRPPGRAVLVMMLGAGVLAIGLAVRAGGAGHPGDCSAGQTYQTRYVRAQCANP